MVINNGLTIAFVKTIGNNSFKLVQALPITFNRVYCVLCGSKDTDLANDGNSTGHRVAMTWCAVIFAYNTSSFTMGYIRSISEHFHLFIGN